MPGNLLLAHFTNSPANSDRPHITCFASGVGQSTGTNTNTNKTKRQTMKRLKQLVMGAALAIAMGSSASAINLNDPGVVGTVTDGAPASIEDEVVYVNTLLGLGANVTQTIADELYKTSSTDYNGTVSADGAFKMNTTDAGFSLTVSGYEYVLAKYDGLNGGSILFFVDGGTIVLPGTSEPLWTNPGGNGFGISHWTGFGPNDPPPSVPDAGSTLAMIGAAMTSLGFLRRKLS
jgi:hypothetical protein